MNENSLITLGCPLYNNSDTESWCARIGPLQFHSSTTRSTDEVYEDDTAASIWGAAWSFATHLLDSRSTSVLRPCTDHYAVSGKTVVELGAGTGVGGLAAACAGAKSVMLTDLPDNIHLLHESLHCNRAALTARRGCDYDIGVRALRWGSCSQKQSLTWGVGGDCASVADESDVLGEGEKEKEKTTYDVVIAVDCIYCHSLHDMLAQTAVQLCNEGGRVLIADEERWKDQASWWERTASEYGLVLQSQTELPPHPCVPRKVILREYSVDAAVALSKLQRESCACVEGEEEYEAEDAEEREEDIS